MLATRFYKPPEANEDATDRIIGLHFRSSDALHGSIHHPLYTVDRPNGALFSHLRTHPAIPLATDILAI